MNAILINTSMARLFFERWFFRPPRFHFVTIVKLIFCLFVLYLLNVITGVQDLWSEKSFKDEYHLTMTKIDLTKIDEEHPENVLGEAKYILPNKFLIKNQYLCNDKQSHPHLLILVKSAIENWKARQAIRMTWAKREFLEKNSIKLAFVLGSSERNLTIDKESQQYGDIIQIDKIDYYYHNSYKMVMMLRWISEYCTSPSDLRKYVLFIDDDYYLNLKSLLNYLNKVDQDIDMTSDERRTFLTGYVYPESRPRRFLNDRWYISIEDYPYDRYPPYVTAGCFLMTRSNAHLFYLASKYISLFRFDDIYMGMLAYSMSIKLIPNNELFSSYGSLGIFSNNGTSFLSKWKSFLTGGNQIQSTIQPICIHGYRGDELIKIWNDIYQTNLTLPMII